MPQRREGVFSFFILNFLSTQSLTLTHQKKWWQTYISASPRNVKTLHFSMFFYFMLCSCCPYGLVRCKHNKHLVRIRKRWCLGLKYDPHKHIWRCTGVSSETPGFVARNMAGNFLTPHQKIPVLFPETWPQMSRILIKNIQLRHAYRCLQKDSLVSHLLADNSTTIPSPSRYDSCVAYMLYKYDMTCFVEISFLYVGL